MIAVGGFDNPGVGAPGADAPAAGGGNGSGSTSGSDGTSSVVGTQIFNLLFVKKDASSILEVLVYANLASGDDLQLIGYLLLDGVVRQTSVANIILDTQNSKGQMPLTIPAFLTGVPAGSHSIAFSILNREPDSPLLVRAGTAIKISELRNY